MEELYMASNNGELSYVETDSGILLEQGSQGYVSEKTGEEASQQNVIQTQAPNTTLSSDRVYIIQQVPQQAETQYGTVNSQVVEAKPTSSVIQNVQIGPSNNAEIVQPTVAQQRILQVIQQQPTIQITNQQVVHLPLQQQPQIIQQGPIAVSNQQPTHITYLQKSFTDETGKVHLIRHPVNLTNFQTATGQRPAIRLSIPHQTIPLSNPQLRIVQQNFQQCPQTTTPQPRHRSPRQTSPRHRPPQQLSPRQNSGNQLQRPPQRFSSTFQENYLKQLEHKAALTQKRGGPKRDGVTQQRRNLSQKLKKQNRSPIKSPEIEITHDFTAGDLKQNSELRMVTANATVNSDKSYSLSIKDGPSPVSTTATAIMNQAVISNVIGVQNSETPKQKSPTKKLTLQQYKERNELLGKEGPQIITTSGSSIMQHKIVDGRNVQGSLFLLNDGKTKIINTANSASLISSNGNRVQLAVGTSSASQSPALLVIKNPLKNGEKTIANFVPKQYVTATSSIKGPKMKCARIVEVEKSQMPTSTTNGRAKLVVCINCGIENDRLMYCSNCKYPLNKGSRSVITRITETSSNVTTTAATNQVFYGPVNPQVDTKPAVSSGRGRGRRPRAKSKTYEEPEILTLSSDDDEDDKKKPTVKNCPEPNSEVNDCPPVPVSMSDQITRKEPDMSTDMEDLLDSLDNCTVVPVKMGLPNCAISTVSLICRSIRIGTYKFIPQRNIELKQGDSIKIYAPVLTEGPESVDLVGITIQFRCMTRILAHFGNQMPVIFIYLRPSAAKNIKNNLNMFDKSKNYYDPSSPEQSHRRITILPAKLEDETKQVLKDILNIYLLNKVTGCRTRLFIEISLKEANEILVKSSPQEAQSILKKATIPMHIETKTLLVYPPPPNKGGITITTDDYVCLEEEQFLNDVILDFYLKWILMDKLSPEERNRTHIFSTFFYKRLTSKPKKGRRVHSQEDNPDLTAAQKRHARVKSWTKNVDIFEKDFILIPINEHSHWFLAVICFPGLDGPVSITDGIPIQTQIEKKSPQKQKIKLKVETQLVDDVEWSDRDEAEADEDELESEGDEEEEKVAIKDEVKKEETKEGIGEEVKKEGDKIEENKSNEGDSKEDIGSDEVPIREEEEEKKENIKGGIEIMKDAEMEEGNIIKEVDNVKEDIEMEVEKVKEDINMEVDNVKEDIEMEVDKAQEDNKIDNADNVKEDKMDNVKEEDKNIIENKESERERTEDAVKSDRAEETEKSEHPHPKEKASRPKDLPPIKQPCILIFDSLSGANRSRIVATLRDYLSVEYMMKKKRSKQFSKDIMKGACPKVPQQTNFSDCGIFTLQFAEHFFEKPLQNFKIPIKSLQEWFSQDIVACKRESIANLIKDLMDKNKPNHGILLPNIRLNSYLHKNEMVPIHPPLSLDPQLATEMVPLHPPLSLVPQLATEMVPLHPPLSLVPQLATESSDKGKLVIKELMSTDYEMSSNDMPDFKSKKININLVNRNTEANKFDKTFQNTPPCVTQNICKENQKVAKEIKKSPRRIEIRDEDTSEVLLIFNNPDEDDGSNSLPSSKDTSSGTSINATTSAQQTTVLSISSQNSGNIPLSGSKDQLINQVSTSSYNSSDAAFDRLLNTPVQNVFLKNSSSVDHLSDRNPGMEKKFTENDGRQNLGKGFFSSVLQANTSKSNSNFLNTSKSENSFLTSNKTENVNCINKTNNLVNKPIKNLHYVSKSNENKLLNSTLVSQGLTKFSTNSSRVTIEKVPVSLTKCQTTHSINIQYSLAPSTKQPIYNIKHESSLNSAQNNTHPYTTFASNANSSISSTLSHSSSVSTHPHRTITTSAHSSLMSTTPESIYHQNTLNTASGSTIQQYVPMSTPHQSTPTSTIQKGAPAQGSLTSTPPHTHTTANMTIDSMLDLDLNSDPSFIPLPPSSNDSSFIPSPPSSNDPSFIPLPPSSNDPSFIPLPPSPNDPNCSTSQQPKVYPKSTDPSHLNFSMYNQPAQIYSSSFQVTSNQIHDVYTFSDDKSSTVPSNTQSSALPKSLERVSAASSVSSQKSQQLSDLLMPFAVQPSSVSTLFSGHSSSNATLGSLQVPEPHSSSAGTAFDSVQKTESYFLNHNPKKQKLSSFQSTFAPIHHRFTSTTTPVISPSRDSQINIIGTLERQETSNVFHDSFNSNVTTTESSQNIHSTYSNLESLATTSTVPANLESLATTSTVPANLESLATTSTVPANLESSQNVSFTSGTDSSTQGLLQFHPNITESLPRSEVEANVSSAQSSDDFELVTSSTTSPSKQNAQGLQTPAPTVIVQSRTTSSGRTVAIPKRFLDADDDFYPRKKKKDKTTHIKFPQRINKQKNGPEQ